MRSMVTEMLLTLLRTPLTLVLMPLTVGAMVLLATPISANLGARRDRSFGLDVALVQVSPPDKFGYCSLGVSVDITRSAVEAATVVIAQVNPKMPRTWGDSFVHVDDIDWLVPHQANKRIIDATAEKMGIGPDRVMLNIHKYGNTTSGTIPLCLFEYEDRLRRGDNLVLAAFGAGFTWGAVYLKWAY